MHIGPAWQRLVSNKKDGKCRPFFWGDEQIAARSSIPEQLQREIHVVLNRVHRHAVARDFAHLQFDVGIKHGVGEDAALGQECAILVQVFQRLIQAVAHGWYLCIFLGRQMVERRPKKM